MNQKQDIRAIFEPIKDFAFKYRSYCGRGFDRKKVEGLLKYAQMGDAIVGLAAAESVKTQNIPRAESSILIGEIRSNKSMSKFLKKIGALNEFFPEESELIEVEAKEGRSKRNHYPKPQKRRADILEGWLGYINETQGLEPALNIGRVYADYVACDIVQKTSTKFYKI